MRRILGGIIAVVVIGLVGWGFLRGRKEAASERQGDQPVQAASRVSVRDGRAVVSLDQSAIASSGIKVEALAPATHQAQVRAYGTAMVLQPLSDLRVSLTKAKAAQSESRRDVVRQQSLYAAGQGVSSEAVQEAEVVARANDAAVQGFTAQAREQWGDVIADWISKGAPELDRLFETQNVLLMVSLPSNATLATPPATALIETPAGKTSPAQFVSRALRADPRLQGESFFYTAAAKDSGVLPGMNLSVLLPAGAEATGVLVPKSAVVWWQGKAWAYLEKQPNEFTRQEIATGFPVEQGWFVTTGLKAGERLVTTGAQLLVSEELRSQIEGGD